MHSKLWWWYSRAPWSPESALTLITAYAFISRAAIACSSHRVASCVVQALTQLLTAISERSSRTLCMEERYFTTSIKIKALPEWEPNGLKSKRTRAPTHPHTHMQPHWAYSTLLTACPSEACSAGTLASCVVAVCTVLASTDFRAVPAMEPWRTAWDRGKQYIGARGVDNTKRGTDDLKSQGHIATAQRDQYHSLSPQHIQ